MPPRIGAFVVGGWLFGIVINLLTKNAPQYYDIAPRVIDDQAARLPRRDAQAVRMTTADEEKAALVHALIVEELERRARRWVAPVRGDRTACYARIRKPEIWR